MSQATEAITKYTQLRAYLVSVHGTVGQSTKTGANLPRMTYADRWVLGGIFLGLTMTALREHMRDGCFNVPVETAMDLWGKSEQSVRVFNGVPVGADQEHGTSKAGFAFVRERSLATWVTADPSPDVTKPLSRRPRGEAFLWYAWPFPGDADLKSISQVQSRVRDISTIMKAWDRVWHECRAVQTSGTIYCTLYESEGFFAALYALVTTIPGTFLRFGYSSEAQLWEDAKATAKGAVRAAADAGGEAVDAAADALAEAANRAGEIGANAFSTFLSGLGFWGVALVVGLVAAKRYGVL